jgi:hypothetical protein
VDGEEDVEDEEDDEALWVSLRLDGSALQAAAAAAAWGRASAASADGPAGSGSSAGAGRAGGGWALTLLAAETNALLHRVYGEDDGLVLQRGLGL